MTTPKRPALREHADLDRWVVLDDGTRCRLGELRSRSCVVVLGGPGAGKTAALMREAALDGVEPIRVRAAVRLPTPPGEVLYLDALDEYRTGHHGRDRLDDVLRWLRGGPPERLRLGCRADDWRGAVERAELVAIYPDVVVARLLPLERAEARAVLTSLGRIDPDGLLDDAARAGISGLLAMPLSVRLLHRVVGDGSVPRGRGELYERACSTLVQETDAVRRTDVAERPPTEALLDAAGLACLAMLLGEADRIVRYADPMDLLDGAPDGELPIEDVPGDRAVLEIALGTGLFHGDGERFEPLHRSVAEFLTARVLTRRCTADQDAIPFERLLALMAGPDGRAPSGLRGLYAWFAALLGRHGEPALAARLARLDPGTVLLHGDVGLLGDPARLALLGALEGADDPYFRLEEAPEALLGGLASQGLAPELTRLLIEPQANHVRITVFDALTFGSGLPSLTPTLRALVLDVREKRWVRVRAVDALLNCAARPAAERRRLRCALRAEAPSEARLGVQTALLLGEMPERMQDTEILQVLADHERYGDESGRTLFRLAGLRARLVVRTDLPTLFDRMRPGWREPAPGTLRSDDAGAILTAALVRALDDTPGLEAPRLWRWLARMNFDEYSNCPVHVAEAARRWAAREVGTGTGDGKDVERRRALLVEMTASDEPTLGPYSLYWSLFGEPPTIEVLDGLIDALPGIKTPEARERCAGVLERGALDLPSDDPWRTRCVAALAAAGETASAEHLVRRAQPVHDAHVAARAEHEIDDRERQRQEKRERRRTHLRDHLSALNEARPEALGVLMGTLPRPGAPRSNELDLRGFVVEAVEDDDIVDAILEGWRTVARRGDLPASIAEIGTVHAGGQLYNGIGLGAIGAEQLVRNGTWTTAAQLPLGTAVAVVLESSWSERLVGDRTCALAVERLITTTDGRKALADLWDPYRTAGDSRSLPGAATVERHLLVSSELGSWLLERLDRFEHAGGPRLEDLFRLSLRAVEPSALKTKTRDVLATLPAPFTARTDWLRLGFALDPAHVLPELEAQRSVFAIDRVVEPYGRPSTRYSEPLAAETEEAEALRYRLLVPVLLPRVLPEGPDGDDESSLLRAQSDIRNVARHGVSRLGADLEDEAGEVLEALVVSVSTLIDGLAVTLFDGRSRTP